MKNRFFYLIIFLSFSIFSNSYVSPANPIFDILKIEKEATGEKNIDRTLNFLDSVLQQLKGEKILSPEKLLEKSYSIINPTTKILSDKFTIEVNGKNFNNKILLSEFFENDNNFYLDCDTASFIYIAILFEYGYKAEIILLDSHAVVYVDKCKSYFETLTGEIFENFFDEKYKTALNFYLKMETQNLIGIAYSNLGIYYLLQQDYEKANLNFDKSIMVEPKNYYPHLHRGLSELYQNNFLQSKKYFLNCINLIPNSDFLFYSLGLSNKGLKLYDEAVNNFSYAIKLNNSNRKYYWERYNINILTGRYRGALSDINVVIFFAPKDGLAYYMRGVANYYLKKYLLAIDDFKKAEELKFSYENIFNETQGILLSNFIDKNFIFDIKKENYFYLGLSYYNLKNYDLSIEYFKKALELSYNKNIINFQLSLSYFYKKNYVTVIELINNLSMEFKDEKIEIFYILGNSYFNIGDFDSALSNLNFAEKKGYDPVEISKLRLEIYFEKEDYKKSLIELNKLIEFEPSNYNIFYTRGLNYLKLSDYKSAKLDFLKAKELGADKKIVDEIDSILKIIAQ